jgi:protein-tyrosine-phosphatase
MTNTSDNPETCYFMKPEEQLKVFKEMRQSGIEMLGIYHSHSQSPAYPSQRDCEMAFYPEVDYVIISLKDYNNPEIRAFKIIEGRIEEENIVVRKNILFICVENSCRSQMAEAIVNALYWQRFVAYSAGSKPSGIVNPQAIAVMKEIGIDISEQKSKGFDQVKNIEFDYVITLGCGEVCPVHPGKHRLDWQIDDPKDRPIEFFRQVRNEIENNIKEL